MILAMLFLQQKFITRIAHFLNLENDTSVIYVDITSSLIDNQVVEYTEVLVRPEFSKYYTDGIFKNGIYQVNAQFVI